VQNLSKLHFLQLAILKVFIRIRILDVLCTTSIIIRYQAEALIVKILFFVRRILIIISKTPNWIRYIIVLLYLGGFFVLLVYIRRYSFKVLEKQNRWLILFIPLRIRHQNMSLIERSSTELWIFTKRIEEIQICFFLILLLVIFLVISSVIPSGKSIRNL